MIVLALFIDGWMRTLIVIDKNDLDSLCPLVRRQIGHSQGQEPRESPFMEVVHVELRHSPQ